MNAKAILSLTVLLVLFAGTSAANPPVYYSGTGHYYGWIDVALPWDEAKTDAEGRSFGGVSGHLATITSLAEFDFLRDNILDPAEQPGNPDPLDIWIGGWQDPNAPDYSEPAGGWRWVTDEAWEQSEYANWGWIGGEPNNLAVGEDRLEVAEVHNWRWNDLPEEYAPMTYVIEYPIPEGTVPEPATLSLLALGGLALRLCSGQAFRLRSRRKRR